jgi:uncharacterized ion transporter superfamily protein YfcC
VKAIKLPHTLVLLFSLLLVVAMLTWLLPPGEFATQLVGKRQVVVPGTYHAVAANRQGLGDVLMAFIHGFEKAAEIIGFVLIVGGAFGIFAASGVLDLGIRRLVKAAQSSPRLQALLIPLFMFLFSLGGSVFGMSEEVIPFVLIFVPLALFLGYDSIVGVAIPFVGAHVGFAAAFINPFTLGVAQNISQLPHMSGLGYRLLCWFLLTSLATWFVMRYARTIRQMPELSPMYAQDEQKRQSSVGQEHAAGELTRRHWVGLLVLVAGFITLVVGVLRWEWYIAEIAALFLAMGIGVGLTSHLSLDGMVAGFLHGARDLLTTALVIALAKGLVILAEDGRIIHTILYHLAATIEQVHPIISGQLMFLVHTVLNFFVPSGSGQAALTMPIMAPLSDLVGVSRQTAVLAFQFGDGFSNMIIPTSGVCMGALALGEVPWERWVAWVWRLQLLFLLAGLLLLIPAYYLW